MVNTYGGCKHCCVNRAWSAASQEPFSSRMRHHSPCRNNVGRQSSSPPTFGRGRRELHRPKSRLRQEDGETRESHRLSRLSTAENKSKSSEAYGLQRFRRRLYDVVRQRKAFVWCLRASQVTLRLHEAPKSPRAANGSRTAEWRATRSNRQS